MPTLEKMHNSARDKNFRGKRENTNWRFFLPVEKKKKKGKKLFSWALWIFTEKKTLFHSDS